MLGLVDTHPQHMVGGVQVIHIDGQRQAVADHDHRLQVRRLRLEGLCRDLPPTESILSSNLVLEVWQFIRKATSLGSGLWLGLSLLSG